MKSKSVSVTTFQYLLCPPLLSVNSWMRYGMLDTRDSLYSWVISMTQTSLIACPRFPALDGCLYVTLSFIIVHRFSIGLRFGLFPGLSAQISCLSSGTQCLPLIGDKDDNRADLHVQFQLLFNQFHALGSIHSGVRRNEIQTSSTTARQVAQNYLAWRVFHCGYNIFLVNTLTQWSHNVHVARYKLLHGTFTRKQHFLPLHLWYQVWLSSRPVGRQSTFAEMSRNSAGACCCTF